MYMQHCYIISNTLHCYLLLASTCILQVPSSCKAKDSVLIKRGCPEWSKEFKNIHQFFFHPCLALLLLYMFSINDFCHDNCIDNKWLQRLCTRVTSCDYLIIQLPCIIVTHQQGCANIASITFRKIGKQKQRANAGGNSSKMHIQQPCLK